MDRAVNIEKVNIDTLNLAKYNPRKDLTPQDHEYIQLKNSIEHFGYVEPIIVNKPTMTVVGGHQRIKVLKELGYNDIDVVYVDLNDTDEKALNIALNKISGFWEADKLEDLLRELSLNTDFDIELTGFSASELDTLLGELVDDEKDTDDKLDKIQKDDVEHLKLKEVYGQNPFSVLNISILNTRDGDWDNNNTFWKDKMGNDSIARENAHCINVGFSDQDYIKFKGNDVSILDPTLCEIVNRWFLPKSEGNFVFDTFAGDCSMGFVTGSMNNYYTGIELRQEQVDYNSEQFKKYGLDNYSKYICDDGRNVLKHIDLL